MRRRNILISRPVEAIYTSHRARFCRKSVADGILKIPTGAKIPENRGRWSPKMLSTGRDFQPSVPAILLQPLQAAQVRQMPD